STLASPGVVVLTLRAVDSAGATGYGTATILCNRSTGLLEERWAGTTMTGTPGVTATWSSFTSSQNVAENYVRRVSGWVVPPTTGVYTFWIASDDGSTLYLSGDETTEAKAAVAAVSSYTSFQSWDATSAQKSDPVFLEAGHAYYLEAQHREGGGADHLAVAWQGPGITRQVIPGSVLVPRDATVNFPRTSSVAPSVLISSPAEGEYLFSPGTFAIAASVSDNTLTIAKVQFLDGETVIGEDALAPYVYDWVNPAAGPHVLRARVVHSAGTVDSNGRSVIVAPAGAPVAFITSPRVDSVSLALGVGLLLRATVADDQPASLTTTWSKVSGPGTVTFSDAGPFTTARFSSSGTYVLRLTASDGTSQTVDEVTVTAGVSPFTATNADIFAPRAGSGSISGGSVTVTGAGSDIYGTSDQFHFYYQSLTGDFDIRARLVSKTTSAVGAHTALMARASLAAGAVHVAMSQENTGSNYLMQRTTTGGSTTINIGGAVTNTPVTWQRLVRVGNSFTGYLSDDGLTWTSRGPVTSTLPSAVLVGFAVSNASSSSTPAVNTAVYDNVSFASGNVAPVVEAGSNQTLGALQGTLAGFVSDEGLPDPPAAFTATWAKISGPGSATFTNLFSPTSGVNFSAPGSYVLRLSADDGEVESFDEVSLATPAPVALWRSSKFGTAASDEGVSGNLADPNGNGVANLLEYAFGNEPMTASGAGNGVGAGTGTGVVAVEGGRLTLSFPHNTAATDLVMTVQASDDLGNNWVDLARSEGGGGFVALVQGVTVVEEAVLGLAGGVVGVKVSDSVLISDPAHPRRFMRVRVGLP
ncbi:MAG: Ig-like domain-containing protein, partial [Verrucomicrobium sp.]